MALFSSLLLIPRASCLSMFVPRRSRNQKKVAEKRYQKTHQGTLQVSIVLERDRLKKIPPLPFKNVKTYKALTER